jgi:hypothetical protein
MAPRTSRGLLLTVLLVVASAAEPAPGPGADSNVLLVMDSAGNVQRLKTWKFSTGTRHLTWLAPAPAAAPKEEDGKRSSRRPVAVGPLALEFREEDSTQYVEGVLTLVPLERLRSIEYDLEAKTVTAHVAMGRKADQDVDLTGTTRFDRVNKIAIEAEVDNGDAGIADVKFLGGTPRGVRGIRFAAPKPGEAPAGRLAAITTTGKTPSTHKVTDVQGLYRLANGYERLTPVLMFKKTFKIDVAKIARIESAGAEENESAWQVHLKDGGGDQTLTLLRVIQLDGQDAQFEGLLARVPAGYKLFPFATVADVVFDPTDEPGEAKPDKDKPDKEKTDKEKADK